VGFATHGFRFFTTWLGGSSPPILQRLRSDIDLVQSPEP
jgi:hypothetical protein